MAKTQDTAQVCREQVRLLYRSMPLSMVINFVVGVALVAAQWDSVNAQHIAIWGGVFFLVIVARMVLFLVYQKSRTHGQYCKRWLTWFRLASFAVGVSWGLAAVLLFVSGDLPHQAFLAFTLAGMTGGAITLLGIDFVSVMMFTVPALGTVAVRFLLESHPVSVEMGAMTLLFLAFTSFIARRSGDYLKENVNLRITQSRVQQSLMESEERLKQGQRVARVGSFEWNIEQNSLQWSDQHFRLWGITPGEVKPSFDLFRKGVHPDDWDTLEQTLNLALAGARAYDCRHRVVWPDKTLHYIHGRGEVVFDAAGKAILMNGTVHDVTEQVQAEETIHQLAFYDPLTHLPNRRLLNERLKQSVSFVRRHPRSGAVMFVDLDNFKSINDTKGHGVGDSLLIEAARRMAACVRADDTVARIGGDEFVVILVDLHNKMDQAATQAKTIAEKILADLNRPFYIGGEKYHSSSSMGISLFGEGDEEADEMLKRADIAMYQAKQSGKNTVRFYDPQTQDAIRERVSLEADLRDALRFEQLKLYCQIQVQHDGGVAGAEILLRWQHPVRGLVPPLQFIGLAEETGLIIPIGKWILERVCEHLKAWESQLHLRDIVLSVNVSTHQFHQADFAAHVAAILRDSGVTPKKLKLELTESSVLESIEECIQKMKHLQTLGVGFSLDDFGTGYSSLAYLSKLPLDQLKIDRSFVANAGASD
ncbi:MAG: diguanylate cyclase, partial [Gammaproteobacteria bacterium]|nr:diguanylate cyclase [Gammaproteobacteria bacterium]